MTQLEKKLMSLAYFAGGIHLSDYAKARMFEEKLYPRYRNVTSYDIEDSG